MAETDEMTIDERRKYLHKIWGRYRDSDKKGKSHLLDEAEKITGLHRKSILRILNGRLSRKKRKTERGKGYEARVGDAVRLIAKSLDYPCAERLKENLVWVAENLQTHGELSLDEALRKKLERVSISTIKRLVRYPEQRLERIAFRKYPAKPRNKVYANIPVKKIAWETQMPGHFEVDTVHHCGATAHGIYIYTLQLVDVATGWSEITAVYGNAYTAMKDGFDFLLSRLPFPVLEFHPDNGPEFMNGLLIKYWRELVPNLSLSRSKPYRKNDNRFVEENNHSLIRAYVGNGRFDSAIQLQTLRDLENLLWIYHNLFLPCMRLKEKVVSVEGHLRKKYDKALTPLDRLLASELSDKSKLQKLADFRKTINPLLLREQIDLLIQELLSLPCLEPSDRVDVRTTFRNLKDSSVTLSFERMATRQ